MDYLDRIPLLVAQLNEYRDAYYNRSESLVSDAEYDELFDQLKYLEDITGVVLANSPTQTVGYEVKSELEKVKHSHLMMSLDKTKLESDLEKFSSGRDCVLSLKLDGCFDAKTRIRMADGTTKQIKDVEIGDYVLSYDKNNKICHSKVINVFNNGFKNEDQWLNIKLFDANNKTNKYHINCTKNHRIYTPNGYIQAATLRIGDQIYYQDKQCSSLQLDVLLGILLGDGWFVNRTVSSTSTKKKLEIHYAKTKNNNDDDMVYKIKSLFARSNPKITNATSGYSEYKDNMTDINLHAFNLPDYFCNTKNQLRCGLTFTKDICSKLTPLALAIFYIDDGSKIQCRNDNKDVVAVQNSCLLHTNRHSLESVKNLSYHLKSIGITNTIRHEKEIKNKDLGDGYIIYIDVNGTETFFDMICEYIPPNFRQSKLGLKDKWQTARINKWWEKDESEIKLVSGEIAAIEPGFTQYAINKRNRKLSYDLEVENTHCYFANDIAVHNCTMLNTFQNGKLLQSETRGNGSIGELITHNAKMFDNLPLKIPCKDKFEIEGEAFITYQDFEKINETISDPDKKYKNPRNLASGSVRQLDSSITKNRHVKFVTWKVPFGVSTYSEGFELARRYGFEVVPWIPYNSATDNVHDLSEILKLLANSQDYPIDGIVISYNDVAYGKSLGITNRFPRHSLAFKFKDEEDETTLRDIEWSMGKTGVLTPVAIFDEVEIDGTSVSRASLSNISVMSDTLGRPFVGETVWVTKRNAIIPKVERAEKYDADVHNWEELKWISVPIKCPICGGLTGTTKDNDSEILICTNPDCKGKLLGKLCHAASRDALNIDGMSEATISTFIKLGWLTSINDIYSLSIYREKMKNLEGFGAKSVDKLLAAIEKSKHTTLDKWLYSLSINLVGKTASKAIMSKVNSIGEFFNVMTVHGAKYFSDIPGIGDVIVKSLDDYFNQHCHEMWKFAQNFEFEAVNEQVSSAKLSGKTFVITGTVEHFANRNALKKEIETNGGKVTGSVTSKTDYLICDDPNSTSSKCKTAHSLGVKIISENEFLELLNK